MTSEENMFGLGRMEINEELRVKSNDGVPAFRPVAVGYPRLGRACDEKANSSGI
jgi:hypothetical protein